MCNQTVGEPGPPLYRNDTGRVFTSSPSFVYATKNIRAATLPSSRRIGSVPAVAVYLSSRPSSRTVCEVCEIFSSAAVATSRSMFWRPAPGSFGCCAAAVAAARLRGGLRLRLAAPTLGEYRNSGAGDECEYEAAFQHLEPPRQTTAGGDYICGGPAGGLSVYPLRHSDNQTGLGSRVEDAWRPT